MSPCPFQHISSGHRQPNHQVPTPAPQRRSKDQISKHAKGQSQYVWIRSTIPNRSYNLWSFLTNALFPQRPAAILPRGNPKEPHRLLSSKRKKGDQRVKESRDMKDSDRPKLGWCDYCHQCHDLRVKASSCCRDPPICSCSLRKDSYSSDESLTTRIGMRDARFDRTQPVPHKQIRQQHPFAPAYGPWDPITLAGIPFEDDGSVSEFFHSVPNQARRDAIAEQTALRPSALSDSFPTRRRDNMINDWNYYGHQSSDGAEGVFWSSGHDYWT
jgi:hypothetical protein